MNQSTSNAARAAAVLALLGGVVVLLVVVAGSLSGGDEDGAERPARTARAAKQAPRKAAAAPKTYVVQNGDTLTSIAAKTGVPVATIERLNPGVDPQILVSGEKLKLR